jgi:hypothetical protein
VRRFACAVLFATLGATACGVEQSSLDANAQVTITGKALAADGTPMAKTRVALIRELDLGQAIGGLFVTAVTLGVACLADHPPALCTNNSHIAMTGSDGTYSFAIRGSDTQGTVGIASTMEVLIRLPPGSGQSTGALALAEFKAQTTTLQVPDLRIWNPPVDLSTDTHSVRLKRPTLPGSGYGTGAKYWLEFDGASGRAVWMVGSRGADSVVDSRILEDLRGTAHIEARTSGSSGGLAVDFTFVSGSIPFQGPAGPPPSRGASCAAVTASGTDVFKTPCTLTSGDFNSSYVSGASSNGVVIDLGTDRAVSLMVARGCSVQCRISLSSDLMAWSDAGSLSGEYATAPITLNRSARYIRLSGAPNVALLRQVSVW